MNILSISKKILCSAAILFVYTQLHAQKTIYGKIVAITKITPKVGSEKDILSAVQYIQKEASQEAGCLLFSVNTDQEKPNLIVMLEIFKDQAALDMHKKQAHTKHFANMLEDKYLENDVTFLNNIHTTYH